VPSSIDDGLAWTYCGPPLPGAPPDRSAVSETPGELVEAEADSAEGRLGDEVVSLSGDVRVRQGTDVLRADRAEYDRAANVVEAQGNVLLVRPDLRVAGETVRLEMALEKGEVTGAEYRLVGTNARGTAEVAHFSDRDRSDYQNVTYTTCRPGREDWVLKAGELRIDRAEGLGEAKDATLELGSVPVAYLPWLSFPIDDRRRSGLLFPTFGISDSKGVDVQIPYYLNLAPNYDATLYPRYLSKRGFMLGGEFRHLGETSASRLRGQIMPEDREQPDLGVRGAISVQHRQSWGDLTADVNYNQVSDDYFLSDFGNSLTQSSTRYLARRASVDYRGDGWSLSGLVSDYQNIDPTVDPYRILPGIQFSGVHSEPLAGRVMNLGVGATYTNFARETGVTGQRVDLYPYVTVPFRTTWGYATPKVGLRYTDYRLDGQTPGEADNPDRTLGIASFDSGLFLERESEWFGAPITQTLEPRLYYVYIPRVDQNEIPIFDTNQYDPVYEAYFLENVFTGPDRVNDANRLSLGLTTRFIPHDTGLELLRLSLGQVFFFEDRLVQLPGNPPGTSDFSPTLAEIGIHLDRHWRAAASGQWDVLNDAQNNNLQQQIGYRLAYLGDDGRFVRARYGKSQGVTEFTDLAFTWPVTSQVSLVGRWAYSLELGENMEALAGIEYSSCCWRLRAFARRYLKTVSDNGAQEGQQDTSFMMQLELRGLGAVGDDIEELLDGSLHGFTDSRGHDYFH
jgi:LPS-assembly protein